MPKHLKWPPDEDDDDNSLPALELNDLVVITRGFATGTIARLEPALDKIRAKGQLGVRLNNPTGRFWLVNRNRIRPALPHEEEMWGREDVLVGESTP